MADSMIADQKWPPKVPPCKPELLVSGAWFSPTLCGLNLVSRKIIYCISHGNDYRVDVILYI